MPIEPHRPAVQPAGWRSTALLFGVPALTFFGLFHFAGPRLRAGGASWWALLHILLIMPLGLMLAGAIIGCFIDGARHRSDLVARLRLQRPSFAAWTWAAGLAGFMFGGDLADGVAVCCAFMALFVERARR